jgi:hypothetical protein
MLTEVILNSGWKLAVRGLEPDEEISSKEGKLND